MLIEILTLQKGVTSQETYDYACDCDGCYDGGEGCDCHGCDDDWDVGEIDE